MCPTWAMRRRWKSFRKQVVAIEANRRASDREAGVKEAGSETAGRWTRTRYESGVSLMAARSW